MHINDDDYYLCHIDTKKIIKHYGSLICTPAPEGYIVLKGLQAKCRGYSVVANAVALATRVHPLTVNTTY